MSNAADMLHQNTEKARERLHTLHTVNRMKWDEIAALPEYAGIPPGTLCGIVTQGYIPPKWYRKLGIRKEDRNRFRPDPGPDLGERATAHAAAQGLTLGEWVRGILESKLYEETRGRT